MKVKELIQLLEDECDPEAQVYIMSQSEWPFEHSIAGVAERQDFEGDNAGDKPIGIKPNDVFILEDRQIRYGRKAAWGAKK